jgi:hypothetical protein
MRVLYPDRGRNAIICTKLKGEFSIDSHFMSELLQVNHIFKVSLPCGRGCAASVELVPVCLKTFKFRHRLQNSASEVIIEVSKPIFKTCGVKTGKTGEFT